MSYRDVAMLAYDNDFAMRTTAAYASETLGEVRSDEPATWQAKHAWDVAAQPGFGDAYASALAGNVSRPGWDPAVISDAQLMSAIQSLVPPA